MIHAGGEAPSEPNKEHTLTLNAPRTQLTHPVPTPGSTGGTEVPSFAEPVLADGGLGEERHGVCPPGGGSGSSRDGVSPSQLGSSFALKPPLKRPELRFTGNAPPPRPHVKLWRL